MSNLWSGTILVAGFALLIAGAEFLVRGAGSVARRLHIREIVIGLTVVAFGTSMPEMVVNVFASAHGHNDIVFGNIIGSNVFNILLILGVSGLIYPLVVQPNTVWREIPYALVAALALVVLTNDRWNGPGYADVLSRTDGLMLLLLFSVFMTYLFGISKAESADSFSVTTYSFGISVVLILAGLGALFIGGRLCVQGAVRLATSLGLSQRLIGATIIAAGTSLPELATSAVAAYRRRCDIAVGNIVGSNIFNILAILGVSSLVRPAAYGSMWNQDASIMVAATVFLFLIMFTGHRHRIDRWEAVIMLLGYFAYVGYLVSCR